MKNSNVNQKPLFFKRRNFSILLLPPFSHFCIALR